MDHTLAREVFAEIQARPYGVSAAMGETCNNCYFKGIELLQRLGILGYTVRGRLGETFWDPAIIPADILALNPKDAEVHHFFVEVLLDGEWRALDPSFQPSLARHGFKIGSWESGQLCFPITKLYSHEENIAYQRKWSDSALGKEFFEKVEVYWCALNKWFLENQ